MNQDLKIIRETETLLPREALKAADRLRKIRDSSSQGSPIDSQENLANSNSSDTATIDRAVLRLDCSQPARVTARAVLAAEFSAVRNGIVLASNELLPLDERLAGVHRSRRGLKRLQSLRDLLQPGFPQGRILSRVGIRSAKASLAETRQRDALASLLEELCALRGQPLTTAPDGATHGTHLAPSPKCIEDALKYVDIAQRSMRLCSGAPLDWYGVTGQFSKTWQNARGLAHRAWLGLGELDLHETRKKFQRLADQMAVLSACIGRKEYSARNRLRSAAENLGRARDLAFLADKIEGTTAEGRALAKRALALRAKAIRSARKQSRCALKATAAEMLQMMNQRIKQS
ncbi:MAG: hypothetical protein O2875_01665 [Planctomycetota bacterium]|nr:hypothetical protein [Planctomycetota bacterium]MDA1261396.1 hypothetical protein [Planctomycetota bacterium]